MGSAFPDAQTDVEAGRWIATEVGHILGIDPAQVPPTTALNLLGLDSIGVADLVQRIEIQFGTIMAFDDLPADVTVAGLAASLRGLDGAPDATTPDVPEGRPSPSSNGRASQALSPTRWPEIDEVLERRDMLAGEGFPNPFFRVHDSVATATTEIGGERLLNFATYNYLGLNGDARISRAAKAAIDRYGTSVSASRPVSGERPIHVELERAIADFLGVESALIFVSGNLTNVTTLGHIAQPGDLIAYDALAHDSVVQGAVLSRARRRAFPHNDWQRLDEFLSSVRSGFRRVVIVIEGLYSMDGDIPELPRFVEVARRHDALLMVDEAHSLGVLGATGRGIAEYWGVEPREVDIWMGTLSKSLASCGGYIAGGAALVEYLKYTAPGFVFSVGMPAPNAAAALAALRCLESEPERVHELRDRSRLFLELANERGLDTGSSRGAAVIPVMTGDSQTAIVASQRLFDRGINVQPIVYPAVEESRARLRFFICRDHTPEQLEYALEATSDVCDALGARRPLAREAGR